MSISKLIEGVKRAAMAARKEYAAGRARHVALAPYEDAAAVLDALKSSSPLDDEGRGAILIALLTEHQHGGRVVWQGILLAAFESMLVGIRAHVERKKDDDLDQRVLLAFLEALKSPSVVGSHAAIALKRATCKAVFREVLTSHAEPETEELDKRQHPLPPKDDEAELRDDARTAEIARVLATSGKDSKALQALLATFGTDESLTEYVARTCAELSEKERAVTYERLRSARRRDLERLRSRLAVA